MEPVREENLLGSQKVIVGKATQDLVLETLGKVYIKNGRNFTILNEVIKQITDLADGLNKGTVDINSKVYIIDSINHMGSYPDGSLVFDIQTSYLYIILGGRAILLVEAKTAGDGGFVKRSGDIMSGQLILNYNDGPSLTVASTQLVKNLNADKLDNYHVSELAIKAKNETITGSWTHKGSTTFDGIATFNEKVNVNNNISQQGGGYYTNNYIGTKQFIPGFQGSGWCVQPDDTGYTLTIDNLVVRKAMEVFELIVNKINATNGSMWISDYAKVFKSSPVQIVTNPDIKQLNSNWYVKYFPEEEGKSYFKVNIPGEHLSNSLELKSGNNTYIVFTKVWFAPFHEDLELGQIIEFQLLEEPKYIFGSIPSECIGIQEVDSSTMLAKFRIAPEGTVVKNEKEQDVVKPGNVSLVNGKYVFKKDAEVWTYYRYFGVSQEYLNAANTTNIQNEEGDISTIDNPTQYIPGLHMVEFESEDCVPTLWEGDLIRCQRYQDGCIRYYDGMVGKAITNSVQKLISANSKETSSDEENKSEEESEEILNQDNSIEESTEENIESAKDSTYLTSSEVEKTEDNNYILPIFTITGVTMGNTEVQYNDDDNTTIRKPFSQTSEMYGIAEDLQKETESEETSKDTAIIEPVQKGDLLVRIGHIYNPRRQGAIYLTSSEQNSPYINMIAEVNRPDYSVIYYLPKYKQFTSLQRIDPTDTNSKTSRYQDFYVQSPNFNALYKPGSDFYNLYQPYTIEQGLAESALDPRDDKVVDTPESKDIALTNSITDLTKYSGDKPASMSYSSRLLYVSETSNEPYINVSSYVDSMEVTKYNGVTYFIGSL